MESEVTEPSLPDLARDLDQAAAEYVSAIDACATARRDESLALNRLNSRQKAFDNGVAKLRAAAAMRGSDWARAK